MTGGPLGFWQATPRILAAAVKGALARARDDQDRAAWQAWTTAALGRVDRMPSLDSIITSARPVAPRPPQTWQEQLAAAQAWVAATT